MKKRWFTLIEMLIVIVIIGILAWALIPRIGSARDKANDTAREANVRSLATAMVSYGMDHNWYPKEGTDITATGTVFKVGHTTYVLDDTWTWLSAYSIPTNNFDWQPVSTDKYYYRQVENSNHFVIYAVLSAWTGWEWWNCDTSKVSLTGLTYDELNKMTTWDSFCYFQ
jgi:prepilin-type N-terminal cleavage/methylation domain-containing protein